MSKYSTKIGKKIEAQLKEYLKHVAIAPSRYLLFDKDLRLMKSGDQFGFDLNWDLNFNIGGTDYRWYFEAKGRGRSKYRKNKHYENFTLNLISDKVLQLLGRGDLNIDCWCLFTPYISLDREDKKEIENIQNHLPFKLCIWDKNFLIPRIKKIHPRLFNSLYFKDKLDKKDINVTRGQHDNYIWEIIADSIEGRFLKKIYKRYSILKRDIESRCSREIIFNKDPGKGYFFQYQGVNYYINERYLKKAITDIELIQLVKEEEVDTIKNISMQNMLGKNFKIRNLVTIFDKAICGKKSLCRRLKEYFSDKNIPFARIFVYHKISDFCALNFSKLDSSTYFGTEQDKDILFKSEHRYPHE